MPVSSPSSAQRSGASGQPSSASSRRIEFEDRRRELQVFPSASFSPRNSGHRAQALAAGIQHGPLRREAGGLNESLSDCFGSLFRRWEAQQDAADLLASTPAVAAAGRALQ
jgi:hypothetical protein